jgi:hypothetical protein
MTRKPRGSEVLSNINYIKGLYPNLELGTMDNFAKIYQTTTFISDNPVFDNIENFIDGLEDE